MNTIKYLVLLLALSSHAAIIPPSGGGGTGGGNTNVFIGGGLGITITTNNPGSIYSAALVNLGNNLIGTNDFLTNSRFSGSTWTNGWLTNTAIVSGYTTNQTNIIRSGSSIARTASWDFNGPTGFTWYSPYYTLPEVAALLDIRGDPEPNRVMYFGDANHWDGMSMQMVAAGSGLPDYPSNRFTISFGDVWGWRFNQINMSSGSESSFGADPLKQIVFIRHDDARHFYFGPTNGGTTLQGTNLTFAVTNGAAGTNGALVTAGLVTANKGWTFYGHMTNNANSLHFANNEGLWWSSIGGDQFKALYIDDSGDDNLIINANNGGIILQNAVVAHSNFELDGFLQLNTLTASKLVATASDKKVASITVGPGLAITNSVLYVTNATGGALGYTVFSGLLTQVGVGNPTVTILENTLGSTPTWAYVTAGSYTVTASGKFTLGKTYMTIGTVFDPGDSATFPVWCDIADADGNSIPFFVHKGTVGVDGVLNKTPVEIRVYP